MTTQETQKKDLERELQNKAEQFSNSFNFLHIDVVKTYIESQGEELLEVIRQDEVDFIDFLENYNLKNDCELFLSEEYEEEIILSYDNIEDSKTDVEQWIEENENDSFWSYKDSKIDENYPMWNTLFEFKHNPSEEVLQAAIDSGFGVIESEHFNPMLFVAGAGYSFMANHWIPMYLRLPWVDAERYEGVKYSHL